MTTPTSSTLPPTRAFADVAVGDELAALPIPLTRTLIMATAIAQRSRPQVDVVAWRVTPMAGVAGSVNQGGRHFDCCHAHLPRRSRRRGGSV